MHATRIAKKIGRGAYEIKETGGHFTAKADRLLADGSMLSASENEHLLATIDSIVRSEYPSAPASVQQQGTSVPRLVSNFGILVQWMKARGIHYFAHLTQIDLNKFIEDSSRGLDAVLRSQELLKEAINRRHRPESPWRPQLLEALLEAGIPRRQVRNLPAAAKLWEQFITSGTVPETQPLANRQVTTSALWGRAEVVQLLWKYRLSVPDGLSFEPFIGDVAKHINANVKPGGHTRELPVDYMCNLVGSAFTWMYEYGPVLSEVRRVLKDVPKDGSRRPLLHKTISDFNSLSLKRGWPLRLKVPRQKDTGADDITWYVAIGTYLPVACFIICGVFTGRRMSELVSLRTQSLKGTPDTGYWYESYVGKRAMNSSFPCTRSVADALRTLAYLKELRSVSADEPAFTALRGKHKRLGQRLSNGLLRFGALVKTGLPDGLTEWKLAAHQFRKIFALIYRWRYDHPVLIALSVHFGHVNLKNIKVYTESKQWRRDYSEAGRQFTLAKMREIALGSLEPKGIFGKSLKRAIERELARVELADEGHELAVIEQLMERRGLDLQANRHGYCGAKSTHSNLRRAACNESGEVRSKVTIEPDMSSEDKCAGCLFFATDASRSVLWFTKSERLLASATAAPAGSMAQRLMLKRQRVVESFARNNFGEEADQ